MPRYREEIHRVKYAGLYVNAAAVYKWIRMYNPKKCRCYICNEEGINIQLVDCDLHNSKENLDYLKQMYEDVRNYEKSTPISPVGIKYKDKHSEE